MEQFKECLRMFSNNLLVMLRHKTEAVQTKTIAECGRFWIRGIYLAVILQ